METNNYCGFHKYCEYCDSCTFCAHSFYCKNLKMTEYNLFCYSERYNDNDSFQQKRYRVFNKEVRGQTYYEIRDEVKGILGNPALDLDDFWKQVKQNQWQKLMELAREVRGDDFKEGFEFISGVKIGKPDIEIDGRKVEVFKDKIKVGCTEVTLDKIEKILQEMLKK